MTLPAIHPDEAALLRTVCDEPFARTPAVVYADWLQERFSTRSRDAAYDERFAAQLRSGVRGRTSSAGWSRRVIGLGYTSPTGPGGAIDRTPRAVVVDSHHGLPHLLTVRDWPTFDAVRESGLFSRVPLVFVVVGVAQPGRVVYEEVVWYGWQQSTGSGGRYALDLDVFLSLSDCGETLRTIQGGLSWVLYRTSPAATTALSWACVDVCRRGEGLPAIDRAERDRLAGG